MARDLGDAECPGTLPVRAWPGVSGDGRPDRSSSSACWAWPHGCRPLPCVPQLRLSSWHTR